MLSLTHAKKQLLIQSRLKKHFSIRFVTALTSLSCSLEISTGHCLSKGRCCSYVNDVIPSAASNRYTSTLSFRAKRGTGLHINPVIPTAARNRNTHQSCHSERSEESEISIIFKPRFYRGFLCQYKFS